MDLSFLQGNGWVGVACGLILFALGWYKGTESAKNMVLFSIEHMLDDLIKQGYIRSRRVFNEETGKWDVDIMKLDEEE